MVTVELCPCFGQGETHVAFLSYNALLVPDCLGLALFKSMESSHGRTHTSVAYRFMEDITLNIQALNGNKGLYCWMKSNRRD